MTENFKFRVLTSEDLSDMKEVDTFTSTSLDSGISGCRWHRIVLDADIPGGANITVSFCTADEQAIEENWTAGIKFTDVRDALIEAPPGQYIKIKIDFEANGEDRPEIRQVKLYYPRLSYLRYLPAVYQEEHSHKEFLERFLALFESPLFDIEEVITGISRYFDPLAAPADFIPWLAQWLSLDLYELLGDKNREFILRAVEFYKQKGTPQGLANLVSFLTGRPCCVKEFMNNVFRSYGMEHEPEIYNKNQTGNEKCRKFYHKTSKTVDTEDPADRSLLAKIGTYEDEVHYVTDTGKKGLYNREVIGLFIFIYSPEKEFQVHEKLHEIIKTFLPVFVRIEIIVVDKVDFAAEYDLNWIEEEFKAHIHERKAEKIIRPVGKYQDNVNWQWFFTNDIDRGKTFDKDDEELEYLNYRTAHVWIGVDISF